MNGTNEQYTADWTNYIQYAASLSPEEMAIRDRVVNEYIFDYNWTHACMRCGFNGMFAQELGLRFATDPYVAWKLKQLEQSRVTSNKDQAERDAELERQHIIEALKREAHYKGPGSSQAARVAALGKLAQIYDLDAPKKSKVDVTHRGGVMIVPAVANVDDWEQQAFASQQDLVKETEDGIK
ncbi:terminase small subunit [Hafnia phage yong3]|nr:terminase small subunit [Hafnia phage yong3]